MQHTRVIKFVNLIKCITVQYEISQGGLYGPLKIASEATKQKGKNIT